jgi:hypothetical protein
MKLLKMKRVWIPATALILFVSLFYSWWVFLSIPALPLPPYNYTGLHNGFLKNDQFLIGANYPWINYGSDFGTNDWGHIGLSEPKNTAALDQDFIWFEAHNIRLVRWFVFCDGRSGLVFNSDGSVKGLDSYVFKDMDVAVAAAKRHNIMIMFVLLDFSLLDAPKTFGKVQVGGHGDLIRNPKLRRTFFDNALKPLLARYGNNGAIVAWEVMNEPEWATKVWGGGQKKQSVGIFRMQEFVRETAEIIHENSSQAVTVGSARRSWLFLWKGLGLDFYQYHYYPWMEKGTQYNYQAARLHLDAPCLIAEVPTNSAGDYRRYMDQALNNDYAGIMGWSYRASDPFSFLKDRGNDIDHWRATHPIRLRP